MESTYVTFDDNKTTGIDSDIKESLSFENESGAEDSKEIEDSKDVLQSKVTVQK